MSESWKESNIKKPVINANKIFTNKLAQRAFKALHPDLGIRLGQFFSLKNKLISSKKDSTFIGEDNENLASFARQKLKQKHYYLRRPLFMLRAHIVSAKLEPII